MNVTKTNYIGPVIYILTNPAFKELVKIGYSTNVDERLRKLNNNEGLPYSFRLYAYYKVDKNLSDVKLHKIIDTLNPELRTIEIINGKERRREFYAMSAEEAYEILHAISEINGLEANLVKLALSDEDKKEEMLAKEIKEISEVQHIENYPRIKNLYEKLKQKLLELDELFIESKKKYIAFKHHTNVCDIVFRKDRILIYINMSYGMLKDPLEKCENVTNKGHWGNGDYKISINDDMEIDYVVDLIKQSYDFN